MAREPFGQAVDVLQHLADIMAVSDGRALRVIRVVIPRSALALFRPPLADSLHARVLRFSRPYRSTSAGSTHQSRPCLVAASDPRAMAWRSTAADVPSLAAASIRVT
jgi:hypothetical protein